MNKFYLSCLADAAVREVKEETGIDAGECTCIYPVKCVTNYFGSNNSYCGMFAHQSFIE